MMRAAWIKHRFGWRLFALRYLAKAARLCHARGMAMFADNNFPGEWKCSHCGAWVSAKFVAHYHTPLPPFSYGLGPEDAPFATLDVIKTDRHHSDPVRPA